MEKFSLTEEDQKLVDLALKDIEGKFNPDRHWVASAVRTQSGEIHTAVNLYANSASLSLCAEPIAIGRAMDADSEDPVDLVVTVYHQRNNDNPYIRIVSPCGRCREIITDYGPDAFVILREPGGDELFKVRSMDLLPYRYEHFRQEDKKI